jgi:hypothetical protein
MASNNIGVTTRSAIRSSAGSGSPQLAGITSPPSIQRSKVVVPAVQPRMPQANVTQRQPFPPVPGRLHTSGGVTGGNNASLRQAGGTQSRGANPNIQQHPAHLRRMIGPQSMQPRIPQSNAIPPPLQPSLAHRHPNGFIGGMPAWPVSPLNAQTRAITPKVNPSLPHPQRMTQKTMGRQSIAPSQAVHLRRVTPQSPVVPRIGNSMTSLVQTKHLNFDGGRSRTLPSMSKPQIFSNGPNRHFTPGQHNPAAAQAPRFLVARMQTKPHFTGLQAVANQLPKPPMATFPPKPAVPFSTSAWLIQSYRIRQPWPADVAAQPRAIQPRFLNQQSTVQPILPLLLGGLIALGAVGLTGAIYGAYRYYRHRRRENAIDEIRQEQNALPITTHTENYGGIGVTSTATTRSNIVAHAARQYDVYVNLDDPVGTGGTSDALVESARVHERTHIAADRFYSSNFVAGQSQQLYHAGGHGGMYHSYPIYDRADRLVEVIKSDGALTTEQRKHMKNRIKGNAVKPNEWDTTINELLVYSRYEGIRANSSTVKFLVEYANENLQHRQGVITDLPRLTPRAPLLGGAYHQVQEAWPHL